MQGERGRTYLRYIYQYIGCNKPFVFVLWISSLTDKSIREGLQNLKAGSLYDNLSFRLGTRRHEADYLIGINGTGL